MTETATVLLVLLAATFLALGSSGDFLAARLMDTFYPGEHRARILVVRAAGRQRGYGYALSAVLLVIAAFGSL